MGPAANGDRGKARDALDRLARDLAAAGLSG
jgi:hypothetical protein